MAYISWILNYSQGATLVSLEYFKQAKLWKIFFFLRCHKIFLIPKAIPNYQEMEIVRNQEAAKRGRNSCVLVSTHAEVRNDHVLLVWLCGVTVGGSGQALA